MANGWTVVLDVGKTHSKSTLWNESGDCVARRARANPQVNSGNCLTLDTAGIEQWLCGVLSEFARLGPIAAIVPVAHGAGVALIHKGQLQSAPLDYEWPGVSADRVAYNKQRDPFLASGSPVLPDGLNIGMQLHWLESLRSGNTRRAEFVPWAQYWAWLLCGVTASEITSLGCLTDLWRPYDGVPSHLAVRRGWAEQIARVTPANLVLGTLRPEWAEATGLSPRVQVYCGMQRFERGFAGGKKSSGTCGPRCHGSVHRHVVCSNAHADRQRRARRLAPGSPRLPRECRHCRDARSILAIHGRSRDRNPGGHGRY